jgi:hypothetical protein
VIRWLRGPDDPLPDGDRAQPKSSDIPGLVAAGGELTPRRLAEAYAKGIFPWYSAGQPILWWSPDPRMVLLPAEFKLSRSLKKTIRRFAASADGEIRIDSATRRVIAACAQAPRGGESGTWIVAEMIDAYGAGTTPVASTASRPGSAASSPAASTASASAGCSSANRCSPGAPTRRRSPSPRWSRSAARAASRRSTASSARPPRLARRPRDRAQRLPAPPRRGSCMRRRRRLVL